MASSMLANDPLCNDQSPILNAKRISDDQTFFVRPVQHHEHHRALESGHSLVIATSGILHPSARRVAIARSLITRRPAFRGRAVALVEGQSSHAHFLE